jgi:8-oxo-dGTP pyrophosphatase MutT (NUDIX family)
MPVIAPKPAATVVVVRDQPDGFEVLLVRRNDKVAFMAGAHVFPGGRVDAGDAISDTSTSSDEVVGLPRFRDLSAAEEVAYRVAAVRELVEEAGVLIARTAEGSPVSPETVASVRAGLASGQPLASLALQHDLRLALDQFVPLAHWVTPESEPRRYDTRFFLATLPDDQTARHDEGETTELRWMSPADAVARCLRGEMLLPPPTWTILKQMARHVSLADLFAWAQAKPIVRVQPNLVRDERQTMLTLPGDPLMPTLPGWEIPEDTRFVLEEGKGWKPVRAS